MNTRVAGTRRAGRSAIGRWTALAAPLAGLVLLVLGVMAAPAPAAPPLLSRLFDPSPTWLVATLQATFTGQTGATLNDQVGNAVAVSGDTALVAAPYYQDTTRTPAPSHHGEVYVYVCSNGVWTQQAVLRPPDDLATTADAGYFGCAVALDGDTAAIGAYGHGSTSGAVYVYVRAGGAWSLQQQLDGTASSDLGWSVALSGDTLIAGAPGYFAPPGPGPATGAAFIYTRSAGAWSGAATLTPPDGGDKDEFGWAVGLAGDCAAVGAPFHLGGDGAAYVFTGADGWGQRYELSGAAGSHDSTGRAVAVAGHTVLVGAPAAAYDAGRVTVLGDAGGAWTQQAQLVPDGALVGESFGWALAMSGDKALVGSKNRPTYGLTWAGAAYVFLGAGASWQQRLRLEPPTPALLGQYGHSVALDGGTAVLGAPSASGTDLGSAYAYALADVSDVTPPVTTARVSPAGWTNKPVTVTLSASDPGGSGVAQTLYKVQGTADWQLYAAPFQLTRQGATSYVFHSVDVAGNAAQDVIFTVRRDTLGPQTTALANVSAKASAKAAFRFRVNDLTPRATVWLKVYKGPLLRKTLKLTNQTTGKPLSTSWRCGLGRGTYTWKVFAADQAGNAQRTMTTKQLVLK